MTILGNLFDWIVALDKAYRSRREARKARIRTQGDRDYLCTLVSIQLWLVCDWKSTHGTWTMADEDSLLGESKMDVLGHEELPPLRDGHGRVKRWVIRTYYFTPDRHILLASGNGMFERLRLKHMGLEQLQLIHAFLAVHEAKIVPFEDLAT